MTCARHRAGDPAAPGTYIRKHSFIAAGVLHRWTGPPAFPEESCHVAQLPFDVAPLSPPASRDGRPGSGFRGRGDGMSPLLSPLSSHALIFGIVWLVAIWFAAKAGKR